MYWILQIQIQSQGKNALLVPVCVSVRRSVVREKKNKNFYKFEKSPLGSKKSTWFKEFLLVQEVHLIQNWSKNSKKFEKIQKFNTKVN